MKRIDFHFRLTQRSKDALNVLTKVEGFDKTFHMEMALAMYYQFIMAARTYSPPRNRVYTQSRAAGSETNA